MVETDSAAHERQKEAMRRRWSANAATMGALAAREGGLLAAATELMLAALTVRPGLRVLDVASGPGDPAIALAATLAPTDGQVVATDLVPEMLRLGEERAAERGITNLTFQQADAEALPFPDASFGAVTCRFGLMLVPDAPQALAEMRRVLAPGGRVVCLIWGPPERDAISRPFAAARQYLGLPPSAPPPDAPHRFRFSTPGELATLVRAAGFAQVTEAQHDIPAHWPGGAGQFWDSMLLMDGTLREAAAALPADRRADLERQVQEARDADERRPGGPTSAVILVTAGR